MSNLFFARIVDKMKIKISAALEALDMTKPAELARFIGMTRQIGHYWERQEQEYLSELATYRLLARRPELKRLLEDRVA